MPTTGTLARLGRLVRQGDQTDQIPTAHTHVAAASLTGPYQCAGCLSEADRVDRRGIADRCVHPGGASRWIA